MLFFFLEIVPGLHTEVQQSQDRRHTSFAFVLFCFLKNTNRTRDRHKCDIINVITRHGSATTVTVGLGVITGATDVLDRKCESGRTEKEEDVASVT